MGVKTQGVTVFRCSGLKITLLEQFAPLGLRERFGVGIFDYDSFGTQRGDGTIQMKLGGWLGEDT